MQLGGETGPQEKNKIRQTEEGVGAFDEGKASQAKVGVRRP